MASGKVDYKNLWKNELEKRRVIRWRTLRSPLTGALVAVYGYAVRPGGPWFGYTLTDLETAPCTHCGQAGKFGAKTWAHDCPGIYDGHRLPCAEGIPRGQMVHECKGEPSMSYSRDGEGPSLWKSGDWEEQ